MCWAGKTPFYILHYTYGMDYTKDGEFTPGKYGEWRFDKRTYAMQPPPRHLGEPPPGMANELVSMQAVCTDPCVQGTRHVAFMCLLVSE